MLLFSSIKTFPASKLRDEYKTFNKNGLSQPVIDNPPSRVTHWSTISYAV